MPVDASAIERGYLVKPEDEQDTTKRIPLDFNPAALTYSVEAAADQQNQPNRTGQVQHTAQYSAKLSFDAVFDNTDTGEDIRLTTQKIVDFLQPTPPAQGSSDDSGQGAPPLLLFHWGAFRFTGVLIQYRETIDFFSKEGVPLRSTVSLTLVKQDKTLERDAHAPTNNPRGSLVPTGASDSALSAATRGGDPRATRALASANGLESLRFTGGSTLEVNPSAAVPGSGSTGGSVDASANWNASGAGSLFGGQSSAGVAASAGAFAGIGASASAAGASGLNPARMLAGSASADISARAGASFSLGGAAQMGGSAGLSANVGAQANWKDLMKFDDDN